MIGAGLLHVRVRVFSQSLLHLEYRVQMDQVGYRVQVDQVEHHVQVDQVDYRVQVDQVDHRVQVNQVDQVEHCVQVDQVGPGGTWKIETRWTRHRGSHIGGCPRGWPSLRGCSSPPPCDLNIQIKVFFICSSKKMKSHCRARFGYNR